MQCRQYSVLQITTLFFVLMTYIKGVKHIAQGPCHPAQRASRGTGNSEAGQEKWGTLSKSEVWSPVADACQQCGMSDIKYYDHNCPGCSLNCRVQIQPVRCPMDHIQPRRLNEFDTTTVYGKEFIW